MARRETAAEATARMIREGYTRKQIAGQYQRWHPGWSTAKAQAAAGAPSAPAGARPPTAPTGPRKAAPASPRTSYAPSSGMGAAAKAAGSTFVPSRVEKQAARERAWTSREGQKDATIWAAKHSPAVAAHLLAPPPASRPQPVPLPARGRVKPAEFWSSQPAYTPVVKHYTPTKKEQRDAIKEPVPGKPGFVYLKDPVSKLPLGTYIDTVKTKTPKALPPVEQQYQWAQQALDPVHPEHAQGAAALAASMTPAERNEQLHPEDAYQAYLRSHPFALKARSLPWYKRYSPEYWLAGLAQEAWAGVGEPVNSFLLKMQNNFSQGLRSAGTQGQIPVSEQAVLPQSALVAGGEGVGKALVAGAAGVPGLFAHPLRTGASAAEILRGSVVAPLAIALGANPEYSYQQRKYVAQGMMKSALQDLVDRYGANVTWREALTKGYNDPVISVLNALMVAGPITKYATVARYMKAGAEIGDAVRLTRDPALYEELFNEKPPPGWAQKAGTRTLVARGRESADVRVQAQPSRTPIARAVYDKPYDLLSKGLERVGGARLPISESSRALRLQRRRVQQAAHRLTAQGAALWSEVEQYLGQNPEQAARLFHTLQRPADISEEVWLRSVVRDMQEGLAGRKIKGEVRMSEHERRLERKVARFKRQVDELSQQKLGEKMGDVHGEQQRLGHALVVNEDHLRTVRQRMRDAQNDTTLDEATRGRIVQAHKDDEATLASRRKEMQQEMADLSVNQEPVDAPRRTELEQRVARLPNVSDEQAQGLFQIFDARARQWGEETGRDPGEWYAHPDGLGLKEIQMIDDVNQLPAEALGQQRGVVQPQRFAARDHAVDVLDRYTPIKKRGEKRPRVAGLPKALKGSRAEFARLLDDMAGRLEAGLDFAKGWYSDSGREILAATGGDVDRADLVAQLTAIYSPQKPVAPNIALAMRVLADHEEGRGVRFGNANQRRLARLALDGKDWLSTVGPNQLPKVRRFYANLLKHIDPSRLAQHGFTGREVTVDGWMGAAFRYGYNTGNSGLTEAQFRLVEDVVQQLADHYGIDPEAAQAAIWTSIKAERDKSTARLYANPDTRLEALQKAGESFADGIFTPKNTLRLPFESASPEKAWLNTLTPDQLAAHTAEYGNAVLSILHDEGFIARRDPGGIGFWRNPETGLVEGNPATAIEVALGDRPVTRYRGGVMLEHTARGLYLRIPPKMQELAEGLSAAIGDAAKQAESGWARYLNPRGHAGDVTAWRLEIGRPLTAEEADRLTASLPGDMHYSASTDGGIIALNDSSSVLDRSIRSQAHLRAGRKTESKALRSTLTKEAKTRQAQVDAVIAATFDEEARATLGGEIEVTDLAHRGGLSDRSSYQAQISGGRRSDLFQRVRDRAATQFKAIDRHFQQDPAAAAARAEQFPGSLSVRPDDTSFLTQQRPRAPDEPPGLETLAQSRKQDLLGAVHFLNTRDGQRILYLTEQADVSTLLHELIGHGAREMATHYPEQWADIETLIGRPLAEWTVDDHERFARWSERYFAEGVAPTPELVPVLQHMKTWMRSIYGATKQIERDLPLEVRTLFNHYFGAYNDEHMFRIAAMETRLPTAAGMARAQSLFDFTSEELATLRRRKNAQVFARSLEGVEKKIDVLVKKGHDEGLTEAEHAQLDSLAARAIELKAEEANARAQRVRRFSDRLNELDAAMSSETGPGYDSALASLQSLVSMREDLLRSVFGGEYDGVFANRVDLVANWLVDQGYLETHEFANGSAYFVPHREEGGGKPPRALKQPARPLTTNVVGKTDTSLLGLHKQNNLMRWQEGDIWADPRVVLEAWQNAQSFAFIHEIKQQLWDIGRPWQKNEVLPDDVYAINLNGTPIPSLQRRAMPPASSDEVEAAVRALDAQDPAALNTTLQAYAENILLDPERARRLIAEADINSLNIRLVDKRVVDSLLRPLQGGRIPGEAGFDAANTLARWSLIYSNPAYIPVNFIGNSFFLLGQQGPKAVSSLTSASKMLLGDKTLAIRVAAETGELPAFAAISRGRGYSRRASELEKKALQTISAVPDKLPRMAAWVYEAKRMGYRTRAQMLDLLDGKSAKHVRDRNTVSERSTDIMVRFDRLADWEKAYVTKVLFIWPWIRGATAWPFYYAREFPVATGVAANLSQQAENRRQQIMEGKGPIPPYRRDLQPLGPADAQRHVWAVNTGPISPGSTAVQTLDLIMGNIASVLGQHEVEQGSRIVDYLNPMYTLIAEATASQTLRGKAEPLSTIITNNLLSFIPYSTTILQTIDPQNPIIPVSKAYIDKSRWAVLRRKFIRLTPEEVSLNWLNAQAQQRGETKTFSQQVQEQTAKEQQAFKKIAPGQVYSQEMRKGVLRKLTFEQKQQDLQAANTHKSTFEPVQNAQGQWITQASLTPYEEAEIAYAVSKQYPLAGEHPVPPEAALTVELPNGNKVMISPDSETGKLALKKYVQTFKNINAKLSGFQRIEKKAASGKKLQKEGTKLAAEIQAAQ